MAEYSVLPGLWNGCFMVPSDAVDRHLKLAPPDALRALLYILRNGRCTVDAAEVSSALGIALPAAEDAIDYWIADGLLAAGGNVRASVQRAPENGISPEKSEKPEKVENVPAKQGPAVVIKSGKMPGYSNAQIHDAFDAHPELRKMFSAAEEIFARPLSDAVINLLFGLFDWYELPADVIEIILKRCEKNNKLRPASIRDEAENFYKNGAVTAEAAEAFSCELDEKDAFVDEVSLLLRITDHSPYAKERRSFETWHFQYGYDIDTVSLAFDTALKNTESREYSTALLPYIHKVLTNWYRGGIKTYDEALKALELRGLQGESQKETQTRKSERKAAAVGAKSYDLSQEAQLAMRRFSEGGGTNG